MPSKTKKGTRVCTLSTENPKKAPKQEPALSNKEKRLEISPAGSLQGVKTPENITNPIPNNIIEKNP